MNLDHLERMSPIINYRLPTGMGKQMVICHLTINHSFFYGEDALFLFLFPVLGLMEQDKRFVEKMLVEHYGVKFEKMGPKRIRLEHGPVFEFQTIQHFFRKDKDIPAIDKLIVNSNYFNRYEYVSNQVIRDARKMLKSDDDYDIIGMMVDAKAGEDVLTESDIKRLWRN